MRAALTRTTTTSTLCFATAFLVFTASVDAQDPQPNPCPEVGDTHCLGLSVEGPPQRKRGLYQLTTDASDDSGDVVFYTFRAERLEDGSVIEELVIEDQMDDSSATFRLTPGDWALSVTVDDGPCPDEASDAACSLTDVDVIPGEPSLDKVDFYFNLDDPNDPLVDNSGNGFVATFAPDGGVQRVDDPERGGVLEFQGIPNVDNDPPMSPESGYIKVVDGRKTVGINTKGTENPDGGFTICVWVYQFSQARAPDVWASGGIMTFNSCCDDTDGVLPADPQNETPSDRRQRNSQIARIFWPVSSILT